MYKPSPDSTALLDQTTGEGFLLSRASRDRGGRTELEFWVATDSGPTKLVVDNERPVCFISAERLEQATEALAPLGSHVEVTPLALNSFNGESMAAVYTPNVADHYTAQDILGSRGIDVLEGDIRLHDRYLMERFIHGGMAFAGRLTQTGNFREVRDCRIRASTYRCALKLLSLDIEWDVDGALLSVGLSGDGLDPG